MRNIAKTSVIILVVIAAGLLLHAAWTEIVLAQSGFSGPGQGCGPGGCAGAVGASSTARIFVAATSSAYYSIGASGTIYIVSGGLKFPDGTTQTTAAGTASVAAGYITPGQFNSVQGGGGNYTFPASLGIGTTTAPFSLTVVGSRGALYSNAGGWYHYNSAGTFRSAFFDDNSTTHIYGDGNGSTPAISIENNLVGIGTTTPSGRLHVMGAPDEAIKIQGDNVYLGYYSAAGSRKGYLQMTQSGAFLVNELNTPFYFRTNNLDRITILADGNVGVATTTPAYKLTVAGNVYNNSLGVVAVATSCVGLSIHNTVTGGHKFDLLSSGTGCSPGLGGFGIYDETRGGYALSIDANGNTAIGGNTPSATYKLEVTGQVNATTGLCIAGDCKANWAAVTASAGGWTDNGTTVTLTTGTDNIGLGVTPTDGRIQINATGATYVLRTSGSGFETYLQHTTNAGIWYTNGTSGFTINNQSGPLIFSASNAEVIRLTGGTMTHSGNIIATNYGLGSVGLYSDTRYQNVFSMGSAFAPLADGTGLSNSYGIVWTHSNIGGQSKAGLGHQALFTTAGVTQSAIGSGIWTNGAITAVGQVNAPTANFTTSVTGLDVYAGSWFRNNAASTGLYNQVNANHIYSEGANYWTFTAGTGAPASGILLRASFAGTVRGYLYSDGSNFGLLNNLGSWAVQIPNGGTAVNVLGTLTVGGGTGKVNAGTIDPIYTIDGKRYATYVSGMVGQKEETTGTLICKARNGSCTATIDFASASEGSDVWLFGKVTNISKQFDKLTVLLTPAFDGKVWYEKNTSRKIVVVHAEGQGNLEVSYRLTAPRFDAETLGNRSTDQAEGFNLDKLVR